MEADFAVELGADDDVLDLPWASPDSNVRYYDLKRQPDLLIFVKEDHRLAELDFEYHDPGKVADEMRAALQP